MRALSKESWDKSYRTEKTFDHKHRSDAKGMSTDLEIFQIFYNKMNSLFKTSYYLSVELTV